MTWREWARLSLWSSQVYLSSPLSLASCAVLDLMTPVLHSASRTTSAHVPTLSLCRCFHSSFAVASPTLRSPLALHDSCPSLFLSSPRTWNDAFHPLAYCHRSVNFLSISHAQFYLYLYFSSTSKTVLPRHPSARYQTLLQLFQQRSTYSWHHTRLNYHSSSD